SPTLYTLPLSLLLALSNYSHHLLACHSLYYISYFTTHPPPRSTLFPYTTLFRSKDTTSWQVRCSKRSPTAPQISCTDPAGSIGDSMIGLDAFSATRQDCIAV